MPQSQHTFFLRDPRLGMSSAGRVFVRVGTALGYLVIVVAAALFLVSDVIWLRWTGIFLGLILVDRVVHRHEGDYPIPELLRTRDINLLHALLPDVAAALERAYGRSLFLKTDLYLEITRTLLARKDVQAGIGRLDIQPGDFISKTEDITKRDEARSASDAAERQAQLKELLKLAFSNASQNGHRFINAIDIFAALPEVPAGPVPKLFSIWSIEPGDLERAFIFTTIKKHTSFFGRLPGTLSGFVLESDRKIRHRVMNRAWTARPTPTLDRYSDDLTDLARSGASGFMIGHAAEYDHLLNVISRPSNPNALMIGAEGSGKEAIIGHLAFDLVKDNVPPALFDKRLVSLDLSRLVAAASADELQARLNKVVNEIVYAGNVILHIPGIHNLVKTSGNAYLSAADALLPIIHNNAFPVIGTTFPREFKQFIEPQSAFAGSFEQVNVEEVSDEEAERILVYQSMVIESQSKTAVSFGAVKMAVRLAKKYFRGTCLPGSAIDLLKSAVIMAGRRGDGMVDHEAVIAAAEARVNVPIHETGKEEAAKLLNLEAVIHERLIDQEEAVKAVADALREYRSGLVRKGGPIASFLFVGPTGVGKTELAKILASLQFGSEANMVRFDMTEYQDKQSFYRFIGSPDGSVSGALTDAIQKSPYALVLLDEFEKAFPDILDLFLQVLDDGRLTNNIGQTVDFTNTIVIATSNAHSDLINEALNRGEPMASIADYLKRRLTDVLKPELLNRFSRIVIFKDLGIEDVAKISILELAKLSGSLADRGITLKYDDSVARAIAKLGYDPAFGARPLRRAVDEHLRAPLAEYLLRENPPKGSEIKVTYAGDRFVFGP